MAKKEIEVLKERDYMVSLTPRPLADFAVKDRDRFLVNEKSEWVMAALVIILALVAIATVDWDRALGVPAVHRSAGK